MTHKMINWIRSNYEHLKYYGLILIVGLVGTWYTYNYAVVFSDFFIALLFLFVFIGLFHWFDAKILKSIPTLDEVKKGNTAVSQFFLAIAVVFLAVAVIVG